MFSLLCSSDGTILYSNRYANNRANPETTSVFSELMQYKCDDQRRLFLFIHLRDNNRYTCDAKYIYIASMFGWPLSTVTSE